VSINSIAAVQDDLPVYVGQRILVEAEFRLLGVPTDPTIIQVSSRNPGTGATVVLTYPATELTRRDVGLYEAAIVVDTAGQWHFRAEGAGVVDAVSETSVDVLASTVLS
jgi:hypothetical protein